MSIHRSRLQILSIVIIFSMLFSGFALTSASAQANDGIERQVNAQTGKLSFIGPENGQALSFARTFGTSTRPQNPAMALAKRFGPEFGLKDPARDLEEMKSDYTDDGRITARYQQSYQGIPVIGGELIVNTNENGDLYSINGEVSSNLSVSTQPTIDPEQAKQTALQGVAKWYQKTPEDFLASEPALWIYDESILRPSTRPAELVWRMEVTPQDAGMPVRELVLVNAQQGNISLHFNQIDTAWSLNGGSGGNQDPDPTPTTLPTGTPEPTETLEPQVTAEEIQPVEESSASSASAFDVGPQAVTTWYVANTGNDSNSCLSADSPCATINSAIGKASSGDTIKVAFGTYTGNGTEVILINKSITLSGGWHASFTTQIADSVIDGQNGRRGIYVNSSVVASLDRFLVISGLSTSGGGGIYNEGDLTLTHTTVASNTTYDGAYDSAGGGIRNHGTLALINATIIGNWGASGGGIYNEGDLTLTDTTVRGNFVRIDGGGIENRSNATLIGTTITNNSAAYGGGGIYNRGSLTLTNATISNNSGKQRGGGLYISLGNVTISNSTISSNFSSAGGGIYAGASISMRNTILAKNFTSAAGPNCVGDIGSLGYNLIGNNDHCRFSATTGDLIGTNANPINPLLNPLQDNGGPTSTQSLATGSPAINAGNPSVPGIDGDACLAMDQRGVTRPVGNRCDIGAFEGGGSAAWVPSPFVLTFTAVNAPKLPGVFLCTQLNLECFEYPHAKPANMHATGTFDLYAAQHGRDSIDNKGMSIISTVHYDFNYNNAYWSGAQMVYGDAYGFPLADDLVAHELTHGVTQYESNLFSYYQSGAINESFSDLWGEYYDQTNGLGNDTADVKWQMGEDVSGMGALRNMSDPTVFGDPDKMSSPNYFTGVDDNGGVHINSGINNKAVYLMVDGGTFNDKTVTALGWDKTAAIYYEVNTNLLSSGADYSDLYYALQQACTNLIGQKGITSADCTEVKDAIDAVEMYAQPAPTVSSITCVNANPTNAANVGFTVIFSEIVTGVDVSDFALNTVGIAEVSISAVSGSGAVYIVTVNTGIGDGTVRLDVVDDDSIMDAFNHPLGGSGLGNGNYSNGERYTKLNGGDTTGVFRPMNGLLYLKNTNDTGFADLALNYGIPGDYPVVGDWDGNGTVTIGVYRQGKFYLRNSNTLGFADAVFAFGQVGDQPIAGDWDGDGIDTIGVYRPSNGQFLLRNSNSAGDADASFFLGNVGDVGIAGDWNGDGVDTVGVFRPSNGIIFLKNSNTTGYADVALNYGIPDDKPVTGDWNNDGIDTIGVYRNGQFMLRDSNTVGFADYVFGLGIPGDMPIAGNWDALP